MKAVEMEDTKVVEVWERKAAKKMKDAEAQNESS